MNWIDKAFGTHPQAISTLSQRSTVLASNIANSKTPDYLARDIDFRAALDQAMGSEKVSLNRTSDMHMGTDNGLSSDLLYRIPTKNVNNGNTVEAEVEQASFSENALRYQTSITFLNGAISGLRLAIKGTR